jgi:hypothetical protein
VNPLEEWLDAAGRELGVTDLWSPADRDAVLDLARDVAHEVARPAAPLTAYLLGLAVARGGEAAPLADRVAGLARSFGAGAERS